MFVATNDQNYKDIASAIRGQNGSSDTYKPNEMAAAISAISSLSGMTYHSIVTQETTDEPSTSGVKNVSVSASDAKIIVFFYSVTNMMTNPSNTENSGFAIFDAVNSQWIAESHTNQSYAPTYSSIAGSVSLNGRYYATSGDFYRIVRIGGYFE